MVDYVINLMALTCLICPILCTLPIACSSIAGFHHGSIKNTQFADYKFKPTEPVFKVITKA
jgi:hypothetical protein